MRTPSLALWYPALLLFATGLLAGAVASAADPVYKWKDSNGHSHYSQTAPQGQKYETITPASVTTTSSTASANSAPAPASTTHAAMSTRVTAIQAFRQKNCQTAHNNAALLASNPTANLDTLGTGKPAAVTSAQRAAAMDRANQQVTQFCTK